MYSFEASLTQRYLLEQMINMHSELNETQTGSELELNWVSPKCLQEALIPELPNVTVCGDGGVYRRHYGKMRS